MDFPPTTLVELFKNLGLALSGSEKESDIKTSKVLISVHDGLLAKDPKIAIKDSCQELLDQVVASNLQFTGLTDSSPSHKVSRAATEALGIAARDPQIHEYFRHARVEEHSVVLLQGLNQVSKGIGRSIDDDWLEHRFEIWRLIANLCADDDESRETFSKIGTHSHLPVLIESFRLDYTELIADEADSLDDRMRDRCIHAPSQVLYNLIGYEPARLRCQEEGLVECLDTILQHYNNARSRHLDDRAPLPAETWDLLAEVMVGWDVERSPQTLPVNIVQALLYDGEAALLMEYIVKAMAAHTKSRRFSTSIASSPKHLWNLLWLFYNLQGEEWLGQPAPDREIDFSLLKPLENHVDRAGIKAECLSAIADVAEQDEFIATMEGLSETQFSALIDCLSWPTDGHKYRNEDLIECICMLLGNYARSDASALKLVNKYKLQSKLLPVLRHAGEYPTQVMATRLLKNVAVPEASKFTLSKSPDLFECLIPGLKETVRSDLLQATISTARVLISPTSIGQIVATNISEPIDPIATAKSETVTSFLHLVLATATQTDESRIKIEAGRFLKRLLQCAYRDCSESDRQSLENELFSSSEHLIAPLAALVTQKQNAVVRSEGWLAMALLAKSKAGASHVARILSEKEVFGCLKDALELEERIGRVAEGGDGDGQVEGEEQQTVKATKQQQSHDRANVQQLLTTLREQKVEIQVDGTVVDLEKLIASA